MNAKNIIDLDSRTSKKGSNGDKPKAKEKKEKRVVRLATPPPAPPQPTPKPPEKPKKKKNGNGGSRQQVSIQSISRGEHTDLIAEQQKQNHVQAEHPIYDGTPYTLLRGVLLNVNTDRGVDKGFGFILIPQDSLPEPITNLYFNFQTFRRPVFNGVSIGLGEAVRPTVAEFESLKCGTTRILFLYEFGKERGWFASAWMLEDQVEELAEKVLSNYSLYRCTGEAITYETKCNNEEKKFERFEVSRHSKIICVSGDAKSHKLAAVSFASNSQRSGADVEVRFMWEKFSTDLLRWEDSDSPLT